MLLKPGRYHVSVSRSGYDSKRMWVDLGESDLSKSIRLAKLEALYTPTRSLGSTTISGIEMSIIPEGRFRMGSNDGASDEKPVHIVHINSFKMMKTEVTQRLWQSIMGSNPSSYKGDNNPVERVSWDDIQGFIRKLNSQTGQSFRLPSESEWEYAARAGSSTKYPWGNTVSRSYANYGKDKNGCCGGRAKGRDKWINTSPVGSFLTNGFGLHDMQGNVSEWVKDCHNDGYSDAPTNGSVWRSGDCERRRIRGGSWNRGRTELRSAQHYAWSTDAAYDFLCFRLAQD